jgi:tetratricopeptide (TPR) repeat protein
VAGGPRVGPVSVFCAQLDELRRGAGIAVPLLAAQLGLSRAQLYAILGGRITRPPDWERVVRPLVAACTPGGPADVGGWRRRHETMTGVWEQLSERDRLEAGASGTIRAAPPAWEAPRQLPAAVACFTGREAELAALTRLLDAEPEPQAVVISAVSGMAGVGKTALAVHWAHQVAGRFPDGQLYVNLRGYDLGQPVTVEDALAGSLRSLGVAGQDVPPDAEERAALYRTLLAGKRMLIVLDNAGSADQVRPLLPGTRGCAVVVTSRDTLAGLAARDGAARLDLDVLPLREAVGLLQKLIGTRVDSEPAAAAELAGQCCRLPLALRVAAELAANRPAMSLAALTSELADVRTRLDLLEASGDPHSQVRTVFSWSYDHLDTDGARAFRLLSLHPGPDIDPLAAAALTAAPVPQARRALNTLTRAHLIQTAGQDRYSMHDLLRSYAREQAGAQEASGFRHQALTRLFDYYLSAAADAMDLVFPAETYRRPRVRAAIAAGSVTGDEESARAWLNRERANLVAVTVHAASHGWPRHATYLAATLYRCLESGSHLTESTTIHRHALQAAQQSGDVAAEAGALNGLGSIAYGTGRFPDAAASYQAALERYRCCGDRAGQGRVLHNLGITERRMRNHQTAASYYHQAIAAFEDANDQQGAAISLSCLADIEMEQGCIEQASGHLQRALQVFREHNDQLRQAEALAKIGDLTGQLGELTQAAAFHEQSLALYRRIDHPTGIAEELRSLGELSLRQGESQQAITQLQEALTGFRRTGYQYGELLALRTLARTRHEAGQQPSACAELEAALRLAADTGNTHQQASTHADLAESHHRDGQHAQARHHWQQALALFTELGAPEATDIRTRLSTADTSNDDSLATGLPRVFRTCD